VLEAHEHVGADVVHVREDAPEPHVNAVGDAVELGERDDHLFSVVDGPAGDQELGVVRVRVIRARLEPRGRDDRAFHAHLDLPLRGLVGHMETQAGRRERTSSRDGRHRMVTRATPGCYPFVTPTSIPR
jgi:hypothetical protein